MAARYKGIWSSATAYAAGDLVTHRGLAWEANKAGSGATPGVTSEIRAGGPATVGVDFLSQATQEFTPSVSGVFTHVRVAAAAGRVGFTAAKPTTIDKTAITWLGYADSPATAVYASHPLSSPVTLTAGTPIWLVYIADAAATYIKAKTDEGGVNGTLSATVYGPSGGAFTDPYTGYNLNIQGLRLETQWDKALDLLPVRTTATYTTASLASMAGESGTISMTPGYRLYSIATNVEARVRLYSTAAKRDADVSRTVEAGAPTGAHGMYLEFLTTPTMLSSPLTPIVDGASLESPPSANIPIRVGNRSAVAASVTVTLTYIPTEV